MEAVDTAELGSSEASESSISYSEAFEIDQENQQKHEVRIESCSTLNQIPLYSYYRTGTGKVTGASCDTYKMAIACKQKDDKHLHKTTELIFKHCKRFTCPKCYHSAVGQSAKRIASRITKLAVLYRKRGTKIGRAKHIIWSPPEHEYSRENIEKDGGKAIYAKVNDLQRQAAKDGFYAGINILHLEREPEKGVWEDGIHFHFYGYGYFVDSDRFHQETGWIYHIVEDEGPRNCYDTVYYQLTHCANFVNEKTGRSAKNFRYVGAFQDKLARRKVVEVTHEPVLCRSCKVPKHKFAAAIGKDGNNHFDPFYDADLGECHRRVVHETWELVHRTKSSRMEEYEKD